MFEDFKNLYSVSKTICFKLNPTEITKQNIISNGDILTRDLSIADNKHLITESFDNIFNNNILSVNNDKIIDYVYLIKDLYIQANTKDKLKEYNKQKKNCIDKISEIFIKAQEELFGTKTLQVIKNNSSIDAEILSLYQKADIQNFIDNRKNTINDISKRIISNIELMVNNIKIINTFVENKYFVDDEYLKIFQDFSICLYNQIAIDKYNDYVIKINTKLNEDKQQGILTKKYKLCQLQKTILGSSKTFIIEQYRNNEDVANSFKKLFDAYDIDKTYQKINCLFQNIENYDLQNVYIKNNMIHYVSNIIYKNHNHIPNIINEFALTRFNNKSKQEQFKKQNFTIDFINTITNINILNNIHIDMNGYKSLYHDFISSPIDSQDYLQKCLKISNHIIDTFDLLKMFNNTDDNLDINFYSIYDELNEFYKNFCKVYNCTRNFATKRNEYIKSYHITFGNNNLNGNVGWSETKLNENRSCIFIKNKKYYFGYLTSNCTFEHSDNIVNSYQKMIYMKNQPLNKFIGHCVFVKELKKHFENSDDNFVLSTNTCDDMEISKEIYNIYKDKTYLVSKSDRVKYINFIKNYYQNKYKNGKYFDFSILKEASEYEIFDDFEKDIDACTFAINFENISDECIEKLQKENKLWLFQIYSKDFSDYKKDGSNKNVHTLIFETFFSNENKDKHYPVRLQGGFEIRYRDVGITDGVVHKKGSVLLNKFDKNHNKIPNNIYVKLLSYVNGNKVTLNDNERYYIVNDLLITKIAQYDIVKDRRYINPQYEIHIPFSLNSNASSDNKHIELNKKIDEYVKKHHCNIIGIDRGERNLLCVSVINGNTGELMEQVSLDIINGINFNSILSEIESDRQNSRKTWQSISKIKDAKKGFISFAIKKIVDLVEKYNAVISLENLNSKFINKRAKIEKSIYQQFVNQLINKLAYMIADKNKSIIDVKQLAFTKINDCYHNGIIYYVNPAYTSKIDINTGFTNLFDFEKISNAQKRKSFFEKMDIKFENNFYKFEFDYKNFDTYKNELNNKKFTAVSFGDRVKKIKNEKGYIENIKVVINDELNKIFENCDKSNIKNVILNDDKICSQVFECFKLMMKIRNTSDKDDYLISPIIKNGECFDTRNSIYYNPDIAASYNIAIKAMLNFYQNKKELKDYFEYYSK